MFYSIAGIVLGGLLLISSYLTYKGSKEKKLFLIISIFFSLGLIGSGVGGFFMPEKYEFVTIILLTVFSVGYLIFYYLILKERKNS